MLLATVVFIGSAIDVPGRIGKFHQPGRNTRSKILWKKTGATAPDNSARP
ncbi:hypothetical protein BN1221_00974c [Brenneria goodwinii]|uniref:Uncharacterized protein n=1 Tax=Brenneria goodwinii TaxID=1109412 RepID=A0A0G4JRL4_9GAMM|nr:hypothetical protein BN1221_00974c [Brenneria goodwinii]